VCGTLGKRLGRSGETRHQAWNCEEENEERWDVGGERRASTS